MPSHNGPGVISLPADMISRPSGCLMRPGADPCLPFIVAHLEDAACRLDLGPDASPRYEGARECRITEVDRQGIVQHPSRS
jgi:hypothetical protein